MREEIAIKKKKKAIETYLWYYKMILDGTGIGAIEPESLITLAIVQGEMQRIIPDIEIERVIANKAIEIIKNDEYPFLKYNPAENMIYKLSLSNGQQSI